MRQEDRGVKIRFVTEITDDNITHCKELIKSSVSELRHFDGVKGNFYVSENEYVLPGRFTKKENRLQM